MEASESSGIVSLAARLKILGAKKMVQVQDFYLCYIWRWLLNHFPMYNYIYIYYNSKKITEFSNTMNFLFCQMNPPRVFSTFCLCHWWGIERLRVGIGRAVPFDRWAVGLGFWFGWRKRGDFMGRWRPGELEAELQEEAKLALEVTHGGGPKGMRSGRCVWLVFCFLNLKFWWCWERGR